MEITRKPIPNRFKDKVAIVTGGASGIGRSCMEELCREGASVAFSGISDIGLSTAKEMKALGFDVLFLKGDHQDEAFNWKLTEAAMKRWGKVNYLVNNAFSFTAKGLDATRADWERIFMVGPVGYAVMAQSVVEPMKAQGGGAIVNISSISGHIAQPNRWTYHAAKGAVGMLTKTMAYDLAIYGIRVNCVSPAWIWTREVQKAADLDGGGREKWEPIWGEFHMLRRCAEPIEVAAPVLFLLSDDASFITATDLYVDGGYLGMGAEGIGKLTRIAGSN